MKQGAVLVHKRIGARGDNSPHIQTETADLAVFRHRAHKQKQLSRISNKQCQNPTQNNKQKQLPTDSNIRLHMSKRHTNKQKTTVHKLENKQAAKYVKTQHK